MATEVQIALQPQAGQDPTTALTAAAAKLARSSLELLVQQAGQPITGKIVPPPPNLPSGFSQVAVADMILTLKLSTPLPVGTPVRIDVQQNPAGQPAVTVQPMPPSASPVPAAAVPMTPSAPLLPQQAPLPAQPVPQQLPQQQPAVVVQQSPAPAPAAPVSAPPPQPPTANATAPQPPQILPVTQPAQVPAAAPAQQGPAPAPTPQTSTPVVATAAQPAPAPAPPVTASATPAQAVAPQQMPVAGAPAPLPSPSPSTASQPGPLSPSQPVSVVPQPVAQAQVASAQAPPISVAATSQTAAQQATMPPAAPQPGPQPTPTPTPQSPAPVQAMVQRQMQAFASPPAATTAPAAPPVLGSPAQLVMAATTQAAAQQQSPAPLMQALAVSLPHLPQPVAEAAARVLATRINLDRGMPSGESLKQAVLKSGIFLEAPAKAGAQPDLKQALGQLRGALLAWLGDDVAPVAPVTRRPPPPARGTMPRAQAPELPPPTEAGGKDAGKSLLGQTEGALARIKLMQLGSSPAEARPGAAAAAPSEWHLELPLMLGQQLAMAQIQIQRDGKGKADAKEKNWRLRFALKFSVLGEVGAQVTMVGPRASIAIWADEEATAETLEAMLPELAPSLAAKGLELVSLTVRRGAPRDENQQAGRLMDSTR